MNILISACLLGLACRYDGAISRAAFDDDTIKRLTSEHNLVPFCPEIYGGLRTPREPAELQSGKVMSKIGSDVTESYTKGAREALKIAKLLGCKAAILKEKSPSCGSGKIYDGSFTGTLTDGDGITARLLSENGIAIYGESDITELIK